MSGILRPWPAHHRTPHAVLTPSMKTPRLVGASTHVNCALAPPRRLTSVLTASKSASAGESGENSPRRQPARAPDVRGQRLREERVDLVHRSPVYGLWTCALWSTMNRATPRAVDAPGRTQRAAQNDNMPHRGAATWRAKAQPVSSPTGPVWTQPMLTDDRSTFTVDLAPQVSDTELLDPHVRW
jgi:hypothetical protein